MSEQAPSKELTQIAETIEHQPVLGHWPHMRAASDAESVRRAADEIARLRLREQQLSDALIKRRERIEHLEAQLRTAHEPFPALDDPHYGELTGEELARRAGFASVRDLLSGYKTLVRERTSQPPGESQETIRLRQFVESALEDCGCGHVVVDLMAAMRGEWLYQQLPGWDRNNPTERPSETKAPECAHLRRVGQATPEGKIIREECQDCGAVLGESANDR